MKRFLLCALALMLLAPMSVFAADKKVTLSVFMYRDVTAPEAGAWDTLVEAFKKANPNRSPAQRPAARCVLHVA